MRCARPAIAGVLLAGTMMLAAPSTAFAHASLQSSIPASNSVLEEPPTAIVLDFDDAIEVAVASIQLFDSNRDTVTIQAPRQGGEIGRAHV